MGLDVWFRDDVERFFRAVVIARGGQLTPDGLTVLAALAADFGLTLAEVLPRDTGAVLIVIDQRDTTPAEGRR